MVNEKAHVLHDKLAKAERNQLDYWHRARVRPIGRTLAALELAKKKFPAQNTIEQGLSDGLQDGPRT